MVSQAPTVVPWWMPQIAGGEYDLVKQVLDSNYINEGEFTERFERAIAERVGAAYAVAVTSGTAAISLGLAAVGVGAGDEVIVPDLTFIATANAASLLGAKPVLVDIDPRTLNIDPERAEAAITPRTRAIVPVHVSGRGADMRHILEVARRHGVAVVEDAAEALTSKQDGRSLGTFGSVGCLSFSPNKTITTGQGGIALTNDPDVALRLRQLKDQGRPTRGTGGDDLHPAVGYNFKLTNLQAAVGLAQLERLDERLARQSAIYSTYARELRGVDGIRLPGFDLAAGELPLWTDAVAERRDALDRHLRERNMHCRRFWHPLHRQAPYRGSDDRYPNTTRVAPMAIWLPSAFTLADDDIRRVCGEIRSFLKA
ncbi:MAG TPA: DegT/DnrJ/EryC1/StrS family aminotransferase [Candidatus Limnocylindria bacterium]|nr:DegT/DnrJ/EryC1/StrS family aminotransferase [Candidatus Limnocylindria bacterium]